MEVNKMVTKKLHIPQIAVVKYRNLLSTQY